MQSYLFSAIVNSNMNELGNFVGIGYICFTGYSNIFK